MMIAILNNGNHYISGTENIRDFLTEYVGYIGSIDMEIFRVLANSDKLSTEKLIEYINDTVYSYDAKIAGIYEIGKKLY